MTLTKLKSLTGSQLRILVAEAEGWTQIKSLNAGLCGLRPPLRGWLGLPCYDTDRDAITEAILRRFVDNEWQERFIDALVEIIVPGELPCTLTRIGWFYIATASAEDLCRAFIAAL